MASPSTSVASSVIPVYEPIATFSATVFDDESTSTKFEEKNYSTYFKKHSSFTTLLMKNN